MTYEEFKTQRDALEAALNEIAAKLDAYPRGPMNLTLQSAKDANWHYLRGRQAVAFKALRDFNGTYARKFRKEAAAERDARRAAH